VVYSIYRTIGIFNDEASDPVFNHFGHRARPVGDDRRSRKPKPRSSQFKRLGPLDGEQESRCISQEIILLAVSDLAYEFDVIVIQQRLDAVLKIFQVCGIYFRGNL